MADVQANREIMEARTFDAEAHGESAQLRDTRSIHGGEVHSQRGDPSELPPAALKHGHETKDVSPRALAYALFGFILAIVVSGVLVAALLVFYRYAQEQPPVSPMATRDLVPPQPRLEVSPQADRTRIEAAAKARLAGYGWTDRAAGRARIPIERAMQLLAAHGWPDPDNEPQAVGEGASHLEAQP